MDNKKNNLVCKTCKHFDEKYDCKKAGLRYGSDGYGPWRESAVCINDPYFEPLKNLYEPANIEDYSELKNQISKLQDLLYSANYKVKNLSEELAERIALK